ncbi:MAG: hypothetical protein JW703_05655, partial [Candidatus Diapherotrites archaeon]|nr:hypothetical protein [Candidatus Diapherotrites archaeon]
LCIMSLKKKTKEKWDLLKFNADFKWDLFKSDKRFFGLYFLEFMLVLILFFGLIFYLDKSIDLIPFPYNVIGFIFLLAALALIQKFSQHLTLFIILIWGLIFGAVLYFDKSIDLIPFPYNFLVFIGIFAIVLALYNFTNGFRKELKELKKN